ncbi:MAG TPA: GyrI-like domain-containing protein [Paludibacteraceae bacterium]|nr:GyrI-like domain-containing protein [Paludibacteraceae bacterium]
MEIKQVDKTKVIKFATRATLKDLNQYTGVMPARLTEAAQKLGIATGEPQIWQYTGSDGNLDTEFSLEICIPIRSFTGDPSPFVFDELPSLRCISQLHKGPWMELGKTYQDIMEELLKKTIDFKPITREIYINCDFENQQNCITEVQVVLKN